MFNIKRTNANFLESFSQKKVTVEEHATNHEESFHNPEPQVWHEYSDATDTLDTLLSNGQSLINTIAFREDLSKDSLGREALSLLAEDNEKVRTMIIFF